MHIHILGICGTFMGSLALLAKELDYQVTGSDEHVYPPMSTQLSEQGIDVKEGYLPEHLTPAPDLVVIGNAMSRGNPAVEYVLDTGLPYVSGPGWLAQHLLQNRWVLAVSGTHGKTTTSSMLAWVLEYAGMSPGFLIGGVPKNFGYSARLGESSFFVVEADEYDSAFFDKRSKFVHYQPRTLIINNLEYDHADIFPDLAAIQTQFHHLIRTVPSNGLVIYPEGEPAIGQVIEKGCWTPTQTLNLSSSSNSKGDWQVQLIKPDASHFEVYLNGQLAGEVNWELRGMHNMANGLAAIAAARHVGVLPELASEALCKFQGIKRRLELIAEVKGVQVYDDFAHHPTAIATTLEGLRASVGTEKIIAVIEPRSNTMKMGVHKQQLVESTQAADLVFWYQPQGMEWDLTAALAQANGKAVCCEQVSDIVDHVKAQAGSDSHVVIMSNGGFQGIHQQIAKALAE
ncbi:UDP-N-acetylmuramate:L-alanyl-gamma-D-glutamyl-meso-diaminopimelate ligase [Endozoicomonas sp. SM1973]|uniref:UDP-N-acetylmuramate--L-alanyl-gamma-D-glutamyl-meso-2,6-diaminoheptandioate ligase n=1 Tax=Spartinivicinus marinus TaxID=2994442 RepID=A0A853ICY2_9GAMM|nr:UDP-N-acetylmuramate:L-alanyl-gamma-D-glutamyl-meso-diaminopimelate ligase [Spartinivicinus marinus]MCX4026024.1 UDP-N-acetylmuramate:L-alanyl-gamma-D-glutamyl-meso-diaminopimelate ligase [Spartinivicinus marinus]NYZ67924.1 UDP-N-acetylmuramate:L-alanyl-gamma-D-glutamyl-meso-diaminopimelate ligase [Spartinivicinus marinus]